MAQLWRRDARLAQAIDDLPVNASLELIPAKSGQPTASVQTSDGRRIFLHSRYDPIREAADFCKTLHRSENGSSDSVAFVALCGLGLGYHIPALVEEFGPETSIVVSEPDLICIKTALEHVNMSEPLKAGRLEFVTDLEKASLHERLQRHMTMLMLGMVFAAPPPSRDHHADFHARFRRALTDYAAFAKMSVVTLVKNAAITCRNIANNLPAYVMTPPADILRDQFKGLPAILVAAGPSLTKNIDELKALRDRAIIIAAQTTLRPLLARGINPHFVTSLDFSPMSRQFFDDLEIPDDIILIAEPKATWHVIDTFRAGGRRRVVLLDNEFARRCLGDDLARRTPMEPGATVMHLAFYFAQWIGCNPIIFVGQDLGFTGQTYYTRGVAIHRAWQAESGRFSTLEMKEWERIVRHRPILRKLKNVDGRDIYTDDQMFTYLEQFERDFARAPQAIIDATQGGVRKAGATVMTLAEASSRYCQSPISAAPADGLRSPWESRRLLASARDVILSRLAGVEEFRNLCQETRELLIELQGLLDDPARFNRKLVRVDELRTLVQQHELMFALVRDVSQLGELQKLAADRGVSTEQDASSAKAARQLARDIRFMDSLLDGGKQLKKILEESRSRFDRALEEGV